MSPLVSLKNTSAPGLLRRLSTSGGLEILSAIEKQNYAVLGNRPSISKTRKLALVGRAAVAKLFSGTRRTHQDQPNQGGVKQI